MESSEEFFLLQCFSQAGIGPAPVNGIWTYAVIWVNRQYNVTYSSVQYLMHEQIRITLSNPFESKGQKKKVLRVRVEPLACSPMSSAAKRGLHGRAQRRCAKRGRSLPANNQCGLHAFALSGQHGVRSCSLLANS
jgi:hypothetical protein